MSDPTSRNVHVRRLTAIGWVLLAAAFVVPVVQFQHGTRKALRRATAFDREHPDWNRLRGAARGLARPDADKGAIGRWRRAVRQFWRGRNIYAMIPPNSAEVDTQPVSAAGEPGDYGPAYMHPNTPLVLLLLTPFAYLPVEAMALAFNLLKLAAIAAAVAMTASLASHAGRRPPGWVLLLGVAWAAMPIIGDIQHGNTNTFVLALIVLHLWLFRRGREVACGLPLAVAICLKLTPALFLLYWLGQRKWKLTGAAAGWLLVVGAALPAAAMGPTRFARATRTWYENIIGPGLVDGSWYPEHINQSLSGVVSRYFLDGREGDIYWGPDDDPHYLTDRHGWITVVPLPAAAAKALLRVAQLAVVALGAWAIGRRRLPRDDGRRALHYGLVVLGMMLLNQRTWDHHAAVVLPAAVAVWHAVAFGRVSRRVRIASLVLTLAAGVCVWVLRGGMFEALAKALGRPDASAERWGDYAQAAGPMFAYFALLYAAGVMLAVSLRGREDPYAKERQRLGAP